MKKVFIIVTAAVATIACTKEANIEEKSLATEGGLISIEATVSPFVDDETKASISTGEGGAVTGTFTWSEGDQIAFPVTESPEYVALTYNPENGKFEGKANDGQAIDNTRQIVYPASRVIGGSYSTTFASIAEAKAGFKMTASVPASLSQKITMTHESALVHIQFTNVPDFTDKLVVSDGSSNVASVSIGETSGTVDFYVPVTPDGSKPYSFSLEDSNGNVIKRVSKTKSLAAGKYYNTPAVPINRYIVIKNSSDPNHCLGLQGRYANNDEYVENWSVKSLIDIGTLKYIILDDVYSSAEALRIVLRNSSDNLYDVNWVLNDRNFVFDVTDNKMKTSYRIYPYNQNESLASPYIWVGKCSPLTFKIVNETIISTPYIHCWIEGSPDVDITTWPGEAMVDTGETVGDHHVWSYTLPDSYYGKNIGFKIGNGSDWYTEDQYYNFVNSNTGFDKGYLYSDSSDSGKLKISNRAESNQTRTLDISPAWPGQSLSKVNTVDASVFFELSDDYYEYTLKAVFSNNGSSSTEGWYPYVNRDYRHGY